MAGPLDKNSKQYFTTRMSELDTERSSFVGHWRELSDFVTPRRGRFFSQDRNKGDKRWNNIINSRASLAHRVARSGMLAGMMSPARPWFALEVMNNEVMEDPASRIWLSDSAKQLRSIFNDGNLYSMAPVLLGELLSFGTGAMLHVDDFESVARFYTQTVGSYFISQNSRYEIDTLVRDFEMTTSQMIEEYGLDKVSIKVREAYDRGNYHQWYRVIQFIEPNPNVDQRSARSENKPFRSVYFEWGTDALAESNKFLRVKGFDSFPAHCPRWDLTNEDVYGTDCPAMMALGDIKSLQIEERRKAQAIDKMVNPPLKGPPSLRNANVSSLPGGLVTYEGDQNNKLEPIYQVQPQLQEMRADIDAVERRINEVFFTDLFLAITNIEGIQPRNQFDLIQRNEERLLQLGPVLERFNGEFLGPLVERTFDQALKAGILPPPPPKLEGQQLKIEFISTLAMAQRSVATSSIDRITAYAGGLIGLGFEGIKDKFDADQAVDEYAHAIGVPPRIIVSDEEIAKVRQERQQMQQMQQMMEMGQQAANTAKMAADAKTGGEANMLTDLQKAASRG
ncbi:MAG: portal protein [Chloroflexi bacterium]|nr:portal protein [Chloroflexota bacterium]